MHIHRPRFDEPLVAPDPFQQPIARQHAIAILDQIAEQLELASREPDVRAVHTHGDGVEVGQQMLAAIDDRGFLPGGIGVAAPQHGAHAGRQLPKTERLDDVVVGADVEPRHPVAFAGARRQHDDGNVRSRRARAQDAAHFEAAQHRQVQVQQDQVRLAIGDDPERGITGIDDVDVYAAHLLERVLDQSGDVLLVLDDQNAGTRAG